MALSMENKCVACNSQQSVHKNECMPMDLLRSFEWIITHLLTMMINTNQWISIDVNSFDSIPQDFRSIINYLKLVESQIEINQT